MPATLKKPLVRRLASSLDKTFGADAGKRLVMRVEPGTANRGDLIELRPEHTRRVEQITVADVYRYAIRSRVSLELQAKARERKAKKAERRERDRIARADRKIQREAKELQRIH